jgi:hypothetical protein
VWWDIFNLNIRGCEVIILISYMYSHEFLRSFWWYNFFMLPNPRDNLAYFVCAKSLSRFTTRKLINTNGNTKKIFSSVNFREILPTEIFHRYIPMKLPWEKKFKTKQKKRWRVIFTDGITDGIFHRYFPESVIWRFSEKIQLI